ncbi:MAG: hypothetical protein ACXVXC_08050 [Nocardioidaceae bacterium]
MTDPFPARDNRPGHDDRAGRRPTKPTRRQMNLEILVGGLGFFTAAAFVDAVVAEVRGKPALTEALVLLCLVVALGLAYRAWRRSLPRR